MTFVELEQRAKCQTRQSIPLLSEKAYSQSVWPEKKISTLAICDKRHERLVRIRNGYRVSTEVSDYFSISDMSWQCNELALK